MVHVQPQSSDLVNRLDLADVALSMDSRAHLLEGTARPQCAQAEHVERFCGLSLGSAALSVETGGHALGYPDMGKKGACDMMRVLVLARAPSSRGRKIVGNSGRSGWVEGDQARWAASGSTCPARTSADNGNRCGTVTSSHPCIACILLE